MNRADSGERSGQESQLLAADDAVALGLCSGVFIIVWRSEMRPSAIRTIGEQLAARPAPRGAFVVVEPKFPMPSSEERGELVRVIRPFSAVPTAVVFERDGFLSAAVRAAVTGISLLLGTTHPRIFQSIGAATVWMEAALTGGLGAAELEATVQSTRSAGAR